MTKKYDEDDIQRYVEFSVEVFKEQFKDTLVSLDYIREQVQHIPQMRQDIAELKADMKTVKHAIRETNKDVAWLKSVAHTH